MATRIGLIWQGFRRIAQRARTAAVVLGLLALVQYGVRPGVWPGIWTDAAFAQDAKPADPPAFVGTMRQFTLLKPLRPAPWQTIKDEAGKPIDLAALKGKVVLLNMWATWCAPCVHEMPSLDKLKAEMSDPRFELIALSIDRDGVDKVKPFYEKLGLKTLAIRLDDGNANFRAFAVRGLPTTYLIDHDGNIAGYLEGPADWSSPQAKALLKYYLDRVPAAKPQ